MLIQVIIQVATAAVRALDDAGDFLNAVDT